MDQNISFGVYLHIPYCRQACHYCDFHFSTQRDSERDMVLAMGEEMDLRFKAIEQKQKASPIEVSSIYFGGGTPSILSSLNLSYLFEKLKSSTLYPSDIEITLEANPEDISEENLVFWKSLGVNRLSIGIQTFDSAILKSLNRVHDGETAWESVKLAQSLGWTEISVDLMYGLMGQTLESFQSDLEKVLSLNVPHISAYGLTIEEKTVFGKWTKTAQLPPLNEGLMQEEFQVLIGTLTQAGYEHYEISNFAKPGAYAKHNTAYWQGKPYVGIGPGAHGYIAPYRSANVAHNAKYIQSLMSGSLAEELELVDSITQLNEQILTGLRTQWGIPQTAFQELLIQHCTLKERSDFYETLAKFEARNWIIQRNGAWVLSVEGKMFADRIASDLMVVR